MFSMFFSLTLLSLKPQKPCQTAGESVSPRFFVYFTAQQRDRHWHSGLRWLQQFSGAQFRDEGRAGGHRSSLPWFGWCFHLRFSNPVWARRNHLTHLTMFWEGFKAPTKSKRKELITVARLPEKPRDKRSR